MPAELFVALAATPPNMDLTQTQSAAVQADFRTEALCWLPNVARYARLLTRNQTDAEDLAQETFLRAFLKWGTFRPGSDCRKWLFTICRHVFLRAQQRSRRLIAMDDPDAEMQFTADLYWEAAAASIDMLSDRMEVAPALECGLDAMQPEYRAVVILIDVEGNSYADAAVALEVPVGTVRSRLFRARRILQEALIEHARDFGLASSTPQRDQRRLA